jgi:hypothetical protein
MRVGRFLVGFVALLALVPALVLAVQTVTRDRAVRDTPQEIATVDRPPTDAPAAPPARPAVPHRFGWGERRAKPRHQTERPRIRAARIEAEPAPKRSDGGSAGHLDPIAPRPVERRARVLEPVASLIRSCAKDDDGCSVDDIAGSLGQIVDTTKPVTDTVKPVIEPAKPVIDQLTEPAPDIPAAPDISATPDIPAAPDIPATLEVPATPEVPLSGETPAAPTITVEPDSALGQAILAALGVRRSELHGAWLRIDLSALAAAPRD